MLAGLGWAGQALTKRKGTMLVECDTRSIASQLRCLADRLAAEDPVTGCAPATSVGGRARRLLRERRRRDQFFDPALFGEPAWDMLLDLCAAREEGVRVSVTSLCIAAAVPATTALRWLIVLERAGMIVRCDDAKDRRRVFVSLSDAAFDALQGYLAGLPT
jgi:DNA-binding MarR family transcriptional regulator